MIADLQDIREYRELNWEGSFSEYLDIVRDDPSVCRNAYQRMYDMIMQFGTEEYTEYKKRIIRYKFFDDPFDNGKDAVFGIDVHLMKLVRVFESAALGYGPEKRVILLHGPVGSAKSTIARLLKKGLEWYSRQHEGRLYTFSWLADDGTRTPSPLNEDPLKLIPLDVRPQVLQSIEREGRARYTLRVAGELDPVSRFLYRETLKAVGGDWRKLTQRIRVRRLVLSEKDRVGIGTFQPKDEKNQDSTELTGDINYRKIAEYG
ncbi:MAG TPA: serine protein kinase, partial [Deltaproteobacteria bacterium]|nr:serine protein kinase [Deltaproteobacteria bacterium]